jgi:hypothetical protein
MKRRLCTLFFAIGIFISSQLKAQDFYAGPVVGVSFSQVDGDTYQGFNKAGMILGGFVGRQISENWKAQLEISFIQKGSRKKPDIERGDYTDYLIHLNYIQFPLTVQLSFKRFSFDAGVSVASLLDYREEVDGIAIPEDDQVPFKPLEVSSIFGVSFNITDLLKLNGRFNYSITRIREPFNGDIPVYNPHWEKHKPGQYNDVVTFSLFYDLFYRK